MASYIVPPLYAAFIWWFSTGAVLLLVGLSTRFDLLKIIVTVGLVIGAICGLSATSGATTSAAAYGAFTCTILLWGAQEITFLAGWLTGPKPEPCPVDAKGWNRFTLALEAIIYHEAMLLACGAAIVAATWNGVNQVGLWTFAALWVLRQSAKINLFLGVPVTNDELMPDAVKHLKTFFARRSVSLFFPLSVTLATAALVILIQRIAEVAATPLDIAGLTLVSTLFALGILEHWFMLLPLPAMTLWGWGVKAQRLPPVAVQDAVVSERATIVASQRCAVPQLTNSPSTLPDAQPNQPHLLTLSVVRTDQAPPKAKEMCARQRLEDQFRQTFLEQHARGDMASVRRGIGAEPAATVNGRTS